MKKLHFKYSAMNAGKSMHLIMTYYNYKELGLKPIVVVPNCCTSKKVKSRTGMSIDAIFIDELKQLLMKEKIDCILVDESQFLTKDEVKYFLELTYLEIAVICYGLRTTSSGEVFEGSKYLLAFADELLELPTLCNCGSKARMNIRTLNGELELSSRRILKSEGEVEYISVCRNCYYDILNGEKDANSLAKLFGNSKSGKGE